MNLRLLAQIDPQKALHESWHAASPEAHVMIGTAGFGTWLAGVNWAAIATFLAMAVPLGFGVVVQCLKQWRIMAIEVTEAQRKSDARIASWRTGVDDRFVATSIEPGLRVLLPDTRPSG